MCSKRCAASASRFGSPEGHDDETFQGCSQSAPGRLIMIPLHERADAKSIANDLLSTESREGRLPGRRRDGFGRVRDVSRLGARNGQGSEVRADQSENNRRLRVRSQGQLAGVSSKRVQTGEPSLCVLIPLSASVPKIANSFVFRFESQMALDSGEIRSNHNLRIAHY